MIPSKRTILGLLPPFMGEQKVLVYNQDVDDIINGILKTHTKYKSEYDNIYQYFDGFNLEDTAWKIFSFLKQNVPYSIESEKKQFLKSPASIVSTKGDCKSYALFANGVADSIRRNTGKQFDVIYRFASYDAFDKTPAHVFAIVKDGKNEYWIDPVLDSFNERKQPYYFKDKKIPMALVGLSGVNDRIGIDITSINTGSLNPIPSNITPVINPSNLTGGSSFNWSNISSLLSTATSAGGASSLLQGAAAANPWIAAATTAYQLVSSLVGGKPDWQHWQETLQNKSPDIQTITYLFYIQTLPAYTGGNGDSQAARFNQYRELFGSNLRNGSVSKDIADAWNAQWQIMAKSTTPDDNLINSQFTASSGSNSGWITGGKINQTGIQQAAQTGLIIPAVAQQRYASAPAASTGLFSSGGASTGTGTSTGMTAGVSTFVVLGLIGAAFFMFIKKK